MNIGPTKIGPGNPTYVIAEIGSNHDGSLDRALELVQLAADSGADCAKFQLFRGDKLYPGQWTPGSIEDEWLPILKSACHEAGVEFMCSVFCEETLAAYMTVEPAAIKIASPEATNKALVSAAALTRVPLLISTGALNLGEVVELTDRIQAKDVALLHCVSAYPPPLAHLNLRAIRDMANFMPPPYRAALGIAKPFPVGFSDHSLDEIMVPSLAVACGASIIEKHFTYDRNADGPDHPFALTPDLFSDMVEVIRETEVILGDGVKRVMASEDPTDRREAA